MAGPGPNATLPGRRPDHLERSAHDQASLPARPSGPAGVPLRQALGDQALWWLAASLVAATVATSTVSIHLVAYLREQGHSPAFAATWTGLLGAMSVTGRILATVLGRRRARAVAPVAAAGLRTTTGNYRLVMTAVALCAVAASLAMLHTHRLHDRQGLPSAW
jgi:hypothetical protein